MKKLGFILFLFSPFWALSSELTSHYDTLFQQGNEAYQARDYQSALTNYQNVLESGFESSDLMYNLGNTYYKLDQNTQAILFYEKALKLNPNSVDAVYNLKLANKRIVDKIETLPVPFYTNWKNALILVFNYETWGYLSILFMAIATISFLFFLMGSNPTIKRLNFFLFLIFLLSCGVTYIFARTQFNQFAKAENAIVFAERANVYSEPNTSSSLLFVIHEGLKVKLLSQENTWYKVTLPDGSIGWLPVETLQEI